MSRKMNAFSQFLIMEILLNRKQIFFFAIQREYFINTQELQSYNQLIFFHVFLKLPVDTHFIHIC